MDATKAVVTTDLLAKLLVILSTPTMSAALQMDDGKSVASSLWDIAWSRVVQTGIGTGESNASRLQRNDALMLQISIARTGSANLMPKKARQATRVKCLPWPFSRSRIPETFEQAIKAEWIKTEKGRLKYGSPRQRIANDIARVLCRECSVSCKVRLSRLTYARL